MQFWTGRYHDARRSEAVVIECDGENLRTRIRGVAFDCTDLTDIEAVDNNVPPELGFSLTPFDTLLDYVLECAIPMTVTDGGAVGEGVLHCRTQVTGKATLNTALEYNGGEYSSGTVDDMEAALNRVEKRLPPGVSLRACVSCAWSDYHPVGGSLACFRNVKDTYRAVKGKKDIFEVWEHHSGFVQETWLCPAYERRGNGPETGYRGPFPADYM